MRKKVLFFLIIFVIIFITAEFSVRLFLFSNGKGFFRDRRFVSPWFTVYDAPAPQEKGGFLYFKRGQKTRSLAPTNTIRIICLGGSTTVNEATKIHYPMVLQEKLNRAYKNVKFEVLNAGGDAFSSAHSFVNFSLRLLYYKPDCIIVYHNINDLSANYFFPSLKSDYANKYLSNLFLAPECKLNFQKYFFQSRLLSYFLMKWNNFVFERKAVILGESIDISLGKKIFKNNLENIINIAEANGINVILATQPACFRHIRKFPYIKKEDFCEYNDVILEVAKECDIYLVDCFKALGEDSSYFIDLVHYTENGVKRVADVFFEKIKKIYPDVKKGRLFE